MRGYTGSRNRDLIARLNSIPLSQVKTMFYLRDTIYKGSWDAMAEAYGTNRFLRAEEVEYHRKVIELLRRTEKHVPSYFTKANIPFAQSA